MGSWQNLEPFFADTGRGKRFALLNRPRGKECGAILYVHPFAEEMNKSRRMAALAAHALSEDGWLVLRCDLRGCGDSDGDFSDASWQGWQDDLTFWTDWLRNETGDPPIIWTLRAGALLTNSWAENNRVSPPLLLWQPVINGQRYITQFLRLRAAAQMLDARQTTGVVAELRETLATGNSVSVAGYTLNPEIALPLSEARLSFTETYASAVSVIDISSRADASPSPATNALVENLRNLGVETRLSTASGPPFWQTVEIETAPDLVDVTVREARYLSQ
jgi:exosortase A-associated hydrolase 2